MWLCTRARTCVLCVLSLVQSSLNECSIQKHAFILLYLLRLPLEKLLEEARIEFGGSVSFAAHPCTSAAAYQGRVRRRSRRVLYVQRCFAQKHIYIYTHTYIHIHAVILVRHKIARQRSAATRTVAESMLQSRRFPLPAK